MSLLFDDDRPSKAEARHDARKQAQANKERSLADADRRNGALMRKDSRLVRLLKAYCAVPDDGRDAFVDHCIVAGKAVMF